LTELIDKHQQWKAAGGEQTDDDGADQGDEFLGGAEEQDDLWDFGTVRQPQSQHSSSRTLVEPPLPAASENGHRNGGLRHTGSGRTGLSRGNENRASSSTLASNQATLRQNAPPSPARPPPVVEDHDEDDSDEEVFEQAQNGDEETDPEGLMLNTVVLPAMATLFPRISTDEGRRVLIKLQESFLEAERVIPGLTFELVQEITRSMNQ